MIKVLLEAPILTQSGYGEHSRLVFRSLQLMENVRVYTNPLNWGQTSWASSIEPETKDQIDRSLERMSEYIQISNNAGQNPSFDMQIHVGIPSEFEKKAKYSVMVTAGIETDRVSPEWIVRTHRGIDKIIVPSEHSKLGFTETSYEALNQSTNQKTILECSCPVDVIPYPAKEVSPITLDFETDTDFNFVSIALLGPRKNLENMLRWFVEEFKDENVGLVLKTGQVKGSPADRDRTTRHIRNVLANHVDRKCKVYLLHGDLEENEIHSLFTRDDIHAYVTATHGEGYGLPVFEAACAGLPIVATNWSAHTEFLTAPYKEGGKIKNKKLFAKVDFDLNKIPNHVVWKDILIEGSQWAYPKEKSFKEQIRKVYKNHGMYKSWAKSLQESIKETHEKNKILTAMLNSVMTTIPDGERQILLSPDDAPQEDVVVFE
jgi:glycosyltransferase involved in cell wall biosynthesis